MKLEIFIRPTSKTPWNYLKISFIPKIPNNENVVLKKFTYFTLLVTKLLFFSHKPNLVLEKLDKFPIQNNFHPKSSRQTTMMNSHAHVVEAAKRFESQPRCDRRMLEDNYLLEGVRSNVKYTIIDTFYIKTYLKVILLIVQKLQLVILCPVPTYKWLRRQKRADLIAFLVIRF